MVIMHGHLGMSHSRARRILRLILSLGTMIYGSEV